MWRDGQVATLAFARRRRGRAAGAAQGRRAASASRAPRVRVWPDAKYFDSAELPKHELMHLLRSKAVLMPGVTVTLTHEKTERDADLALQGRPARLPDAEPAGRPADPAVRRRAVRRPAARPRTSPKARARPGAWPSPRTAATLRESYVNLIPTVAGGTHEAGLKDGLFGAIKGFIDLHALLPKGVKLMPEDVFSRASFVLSAKVLDPQFQGQIKERLNTPRRAAPGVGLRQAGARAVAEPACRARQEARRAGDPPGADAPARERRRSRSARARAWPCCRAS